MLWARASLAVVWDHEGCCHLSWTMTGLSINCNPLLPPMVAIILGDIRPSGEA